MRQYLKLSLVQLLSNLSAWNASELDKHFNPGLQGFPVLRHSEQAGAFNNEDDVYS